ncbi:hypothetical protein [Carbonactinospora thermoautotrophica]|uniref:hypothetical protein n=1 Tax=Carbonactinospora thermoautotrophica TaxID=1469144 RepID=UPI001E4AC3E7|nr:hypothetical protein [Carbonactinospora thermoautotrophica]
MADLRTRRGWSWRDLTRALRDAAAQLGFTTIARSDLENLRRNVCRWESPTRPTRPDERYQVLLGYLYARSPAGGVALGSGSDFAYLLEALAAFGVGEDRLRELSETIARTVAFDTGRSTSLPAWLSPTLQADLAGALVDPDRVGEDCLVQLGHAVTTLAGQVGQVPFARLQVGLAPLVESCHRLRAGAQPAPVRQQLAAVAADAFALAARVAFELRDDQAAVALYGQATKAAGELPDPWTVAAVLTSRAMVTYYATADLQAARRLADAAARHAAAGSSVLMRARAAALQAEMAARAGADRRALPALKLAWHHADADTNGDPASGRFSEDRLGGFEGVVRLHLGHVNSAQTHLERCRDALTRPRDRVQRAIVTADLALARLRGGDPQTAAQDLHECISLTAATRGRVATQRISQVRSALNPWRHEPWVAEVDDHLHTVLLA